MAVFNKKGGGSGSVPLRWLPVGANFNILRLMFQAPGAPAGPFKNPAYKSYIAKISNEPLDFLLPDRSIVAARCVWIISGGRPSQHGFHILQIAGGRENLQRLTGQEGVSSRHFTAELISEAAAADSAERPPTAKIGIRPKPKPVTKPVDDFSDLSGSLDTTPSKADFLDDIPLDTPSKGPKPKVAATDLGGDEFGSGSDTAAEEKSATTDLSAMDSSDLDFQNYNKAPATPGAAMGPRPAASDGDFLSDPNDDLMMSAPGGRTWSLDEEASAAAAGSSAAPAPSEDEVATEVADDLLESPSEPVEPEAPMEPDIPEEEPATSAEAVRTVEENPFEAEFAGGEPAAAVSAPPVEAEAIPEEDPFAELDAAPAAQPEPESKPATPKVADLSEENPFDEFGEGAAPAAMEASVSTGEDVFEEVVPAAPAVSAPPVVSAPPEAAAPAPSEEAWDFSTPASVPEPVTARPSPEIHAEPEPAIEEQAAAGAAFEPVPEPTHETAPEPSYEPSVAVREPETDEFASVTGPAEPSAVFGEAAAESPADDLAAEAEEMAARVAGETDTADFTPEAVASIPEEQPVAVADEEPAAMAEEEPMFADETEAALGEAESLTDPEALLAKTKPAAADVEDGGLAYAHDDVAYFADLKAETAASGDILSAEARKLGAKPVESAPAPAADEEPVAMGEEEPVAMAAEEPVAMKESSPVAAGAENRIEELRAKGAPEAFDDEAVAIGDEVSDAEDIFGDRKKVAKLEGFPEEAGNGRDMDSVTTADLRYTNLNTDADTEKAIAEADSIMSAEDFFKEEAGEASEPAESSGPPATEQVAVAEPVAEPPAPPTEVISGPPEPELVAAPGTGTVSMPPPAAVSTPPVVPERPAGNWRRFTTDVSTELKTRAKQAKIVERGTDMLRFDLKVRVLWPSDGLTEGTLCVKDRAPSVYLSPSDIRKITPEAEVEF